QLFHRCQRQQAQARRIAQQPVQLPAVASYGDALHGWRIYIPTSAWMQLALNLWTSLIFVPMGWRHKLELPTLHPREKLGSSRRAGPVRRGQVASSGGGWVSALRPRVLSAHTLLVSE